MQASASPRGVVRSGLYTAASLATVTGLAAVVGVLIARMFGRGADTDGFFAAYGVFVVLVLAATALRLVSLPALAAAAREGRLAGEALEYALVLALAALPALAVAAWGADAAAGLLTGALPDAAREVAADALVWMLPGAVAHLYAGLAASVLAARDDYGTAALGYALGSIAGLALIVWRVEPDGLVALAWGMALNGAVALAVPLVRLALLGRPRGLGARRGGLAARARELGRGVAIPLMLQALYVVCLRLAAGLGVGAVTSLTYAYLISSALVAVTASSLALVSSVPLARLGLDADRVARHVVGTSWLALAVVAGAAGVFALAGETVVRLALGEAYGGDVGSRLGLLVVYLSPWMIASVGVSVTFPLLFVGGRARGLPLLAAGALVLHAALAWAGRELFGLPGVAAALAVTTALVLAALLVLLEPASLVRVARGLGAAAGVCGGVALAAFALASVPLDAVPAALAGLAGYALLLLALRPRGLRRAWAYVRALS